MPKGIYNHIKGKISNRKGKTLEEVFGFEKAQQIRKKMSEGGKGKKLSLEHIKKSRDQLNKIHINRIGKTYQELYKNHSKMGFRKGNLNPSYKYENRLKASIRNKGKIQSIETIERRRNKLIGRSYEELMGIEKANNLKKLRGISFKGKKLTEKHKRKLSAKKQGININEWKNYKSKESYDTDFNILFKKRIRKRDNNICMLCGIHREKLNKSLHVHHINYDKKCSLPQNCLSLCNICHVKTNYNRKIWMKVLKEILKERYGYTYSDDGIIKLNFQTEVKNGQQ